MNTLMSKAFAVTVSLLLSLPAWAMESEANAPVDTVNPVWVLVFFGLCAGGIYWYVHATNKASKKEKLQQK